MTKLLLLSLLVVVALLPRLPFFEFAYHVGDELVFQTAQEGWYYEWFYGGVDWVGEIPASELVPSVSPGSQQGHLYVVKVKHAVTDPPMGNQLWVCGWGFFGSPNRVCEREGIAVRKR